jgi:asparagine synthase (glutamine-hydrolysing)
MYLLSQRIKAMGMKVVLSGEGADEIFGGYLYFHKAPSSGALGNSAISAPILTVDCRMPSNFRCLLLLLAEEYHQECVRLVTRLHQWDVLRANKVPFAFGLETRVPFLDKEFLQVISSVLCLHLSVGDRCRRCRV